MAATKPETTKKRDLTSNVTAGFKTALAASISAVDTTLMIDPGTVGMLPNPFSPFQLYVGEEDMLVTAVSGSTLTVQRGQGRTEARAHSAGDPITLEIFTQVSAGTCMSPSRPVFITTTTDIGDTLNINDLAETNSNEYVIDNFRVVRSGGPAINYGNVEELILTAGSAIDTTIVNMPAAAPFLPIIAFDGNSPDLEFDPNDSTVATGDMFKIFGSVDNDNIIVRQVPSVLGNTRRFPFEMANVEFLKVRGGDGFDDIVNYSGDLGLPSVRSLLEGQGGNDILLGGITQDNINEITNENRNVDVIAGGAGADYLAGSFAGSLIDNGITPDPMPLPKKDRVKVPMVPAANRSDGDDFLFADVDLTSTSSGIPIPHPPRTRRPAGRWIGTKLCISNWWAGYCCCMNGALSDGGACKNVITWLQAHIISGGNRSQSENLTR